MKVETAGRSKETAIESGQRFLLTLPNLLSFLRIALIPFILILLNFPGPGWSLVAALLFVTASLTDFLDGYFARRYRMVTKVGKLLDPVADKLLTLTPLIMLIPLREVPAWVVVVMVWREMAVTLLRQVAAERGVVVDASLLGKEKVVFQLAAVTALILHYPYVGIDFHRVGMGLLYLALVVTLWSGTQYFYAVIQTLRER